MLRSYDVVFWALLLLTVAALAELLPPALPQYLLLGALVDRLKNCLRKVPTPTQALYKTTVSQSCVAGWYILEAVHRPPSSDLLRSVIKLESLVV